MRGEKSSGVVHSPSAMYHHGRGLCSYLVLPVDGNNMGATGKIGSGRAGEVNSPDSLLIFLFILRFNQKDVPDFFFQSGKLIFRSIPEDGWFYPKIDMRENIAETRDLPPVGIRKTLFQILGKILYCFPNYFEGADDCIPAPSI